jgi:hypothetical protein
MNDDVLLAGFEDGSLSAFHHSDHVRVAWLYLHRHEPLAALERFTAGLKRFAAAKGQAGLYHETITWAYLLLIHQRMAQAPVAETWEEFAARNPDLFAWKPSILARYYRDETLDSDLARRVFVLPDLATSVAP